MKKKRKAGTTTCLVLVGIIVYIIGGCAYRRIWNERQEEIMAGYPDEIKAYLEEKYGREFCVNPKFEGHGGSPVPFGRPSYISYDYLAWENEEDGYAFWTKVYPESLEDKRIREIKDNYCWKFISGKIKEELEARLKGIIDECTIIAYPFCSDNMFFGEKINQDSGIREALMDGKNMDIYIRVYVSPEIQFDREGSLPEIEKIVEGFYNDYFQADTHVLEFSLRETYTEEDYLEIEPVKTEQYGMDVKESEYENGKWIPVGAETIVDISIVRGRKEVTK